MSFQVSISNCAYNTSITVMFSTKQNKYKQENRNFDSLEVLN
jgi:hypothetical protein